MSEQDAGNYACEAENSVSKETSKPETLSVEVLSLDFMKAGQSCFKVYLCSGRKTEPGPEVDEEAAGVGDHKLKICPNKMVEEQSLVKDLQEEDAFHREQRSIPLHVGPFHPGICPQPQVERNTHCMSMVGEQVGPIQAAAAFLLSVHCQNENDEGVIYSVVRTIPKESE
eukprot:bmy_06298T0